MITLTKGAVYTTYSCSNMPAARIFEVSAIVREISSARPDGYEYMPKFKSGLWDGYIRLGKGNKFPTGLSWDVTAALVAKGYTVHIENDYDSPDIDWNGVSPHMFFGLTLRPYQLEAVRKLLAFERGVAKMATNSGKTAVIAALSQVIDGKILILVTKKDLLYQTENKLELRLSEYIGLIGDGHLDTDRVTVGMVQTLVKRIPILQKGYLDTLDCVIFDECHHLPSKTAQQVMFAIPAPMRFGFSGTPLSYTALPDLVLMGATGPVRVEVTNQDLISEGISATPIVYIHTMVDEETEDDDYHEAYEGCIVQSNVRNHTIAEEVIRIHSRSTLILVERLKHGKVLRDLIPDSIFVTGSHSMEERTEALNSLRRGEGSVVIATPIFDEGVDVPAVDLLVLAGGGKGHKKLLQRLGRGMRQKEGSNVLKVIDFWDDTNKHLLSHSESRHAIYEDEGFEVVVIE